MKILNPINKNASRETRDLLRLLQVLSASDYAACGAFNFITNDNIINKKNYEGIASKYATPLLFSTYYSFVEGSNAEFNYKEANQQIIEKNRNGAIVLMHNQNEWADEICAKICGSDLDKTDFLMNFDAENPNKNEEAYNFYLKCRKQWADGLEELKNAGVTVMYRPFVEMNNPYFYGSFTESEEGCASFKRIWKQLVEYLFEERGLDNILLAFSPSSSANEGRCDLYYPGDDYVDVIAPTAYSMPWVERDTPEGFYEKAWHYSRHIDLCPDKPFGFAELGVDLGQDSNDTDFGKGDWKKLVDIKEKCPRMGFFCLWVETTGLLSETSINVDEFINMDSWLKLS